MVGGKSRVPGKRYGELLAELEFELVSLSGTECYDAYLVPIRKNP